jgi:hypothetical protein
MNKWVGLVIMTVFCLVIFNSLLTAQESKAMSKDIQIVDVKLGKDVKDRVLVDEDSTFALNSKVFLWLKITGASSEALTVTWKQGEKSYTTTLNIGGSPWRTWANKILAKAGDWTVTITDAAGNMLKEMSFKVQ